ncbi:MAG TPA: metalloregulator ArsR/SmtB family transcription factor [Candidatus Bathyarchaeia archaeon]|nr:metalloregulator ArsR/SmtB family transcription factor [Candidatus Bathyarchaeia archaeon]
MSLHRTAAQTQQMFNALADPTRRTIIELLAAKGEMPASKIYENFDMTNPAVSQHLKILRDAELVQIEKRAQKHIYSLNTEKIRDLEDWIKETTELWSQRFDRLDNVLEAEKHRTHQRR